MLFKLLVLIIGLLERHNVFNCGFLRKNMKRVVILVFLIVGLVSFTSAFANFVPLYCEDMGYVSDGSNCIFDDGESCKLLEFYNGVCGLDYVRKLACVELGGSLSPRRVCCEGLVGKNPARVNEEGLCESMMGGFGVCIACGDGVCAEDFENKCNCAEDCGGAGNRRGMCLIDEDCDDKIDCTEDVCSKTCTVDICSTGFCEYTPENSNCNSWETCNPRAIPPISGCVQSSCSSCEDCDGWFSGCDYEECHNQCNLLEECYYLGSIPLVENCVALDSVCGLEIIECDDYSDEECVNNLCNLYLDGNGCELVDGNCVVASYCGDGVCNDDETCQSCVSDCGCLDDAPYCIAGVCVECVDDFHCDDGLWCTQNDRCLTGKCFRNIVDGDDGIDCTEDVCDENNQQIIHIPDDSLCGVAGSCLDIIYSPGFISKGVCDVNSGCEIEKAPLEICDEIDNDCDGLINEGVEADLCQKTCEDSGGNWDLHKVNEGCEGADLNGDGAVNRDDLEIFNRNYGAVNCDIFPYCEGADLTWDLVVDIRDFNIFFENYGREDCLIKLPSPGGEPTCCGDELNEGNLNDGTYEEFETLCDGIDNDCDGKMDEKCGDGACLINGASWEKKIASEREIVQLRISTNEFCEGEKIRVEIWERDNPDDKIWEDDEDDLIVSDIAVVVSGQDAETSWQAEWQDDDNGRDENPPEYYFKASVGSSWIEELLALLTGETGKIVVYSDFLTVAQGEKKQKSIVFEFKEGRNFFSLPLISAQDLIQNLFGDDLEKISAIAVYDNGEWKLHTPLEEEFTIEPVKGYIIIAKEDFEVEFSGYEESDSFEKPSIVVEQGWNLIGTYSKAVRVKRFFAGKDGVRVVRYEKGIFTEGLEELRDESELNEEEAYWVYSDKRFELKPITGN